MKIIRQAHGYTLVELLASLVILSIIIFSFTAFFTNGFSSIVRFGERSEAMHIAKQSLETTGATAPLSVHQIQFSDGSNVIEVKGALIDQPIGTTGEDLVLFMPDPSDWAEGVNYYAGDIVKYHHQKYRCITDHHSSSSITPHHTGFWIRL